MDIISTGTPHIKDIDVLVIGAGTAGIPTAIFAGKRGAKVLLLEATHRVGGTLHVSSGHMSGAGSQLQKEKSIVDNPQSHYDDVMRISRNTANPDLLHIATQHAGSTIDWLMSCGFEMGPECPVIAYSHEPYLVARTYWGTNKGLSILKVLEQELNESVDAGIVDLRLNSRIVDLHQNSDTNRWQAICSDANGKFEVTAKNVILATGGYGSNPELFSQLTGGHPLLSPAPSSADGSGLKIGLQLGGRINNKDIYLPTVAGVPDQPGGHYLDWNRKSNLTPQHRKPWEIYVTLEGKRFIAEDDPSPDARERALRQQPQLAFWVVFDRTILEQAPSLFMRTDKHELLARFGKHAAYVHSHTLDGLASKCYMNVQSLHQSVAQYNEAVAHGNDAFGRSHLPASIEHSPFYAIRHQGVTLRCWSGLEVDASLRVVGTNREPMKGLYAIGEILGGSAMSGDSFASGMSITPALTFGRLLGSQFLIW